MSGPAHSPEYRNRNSLLRYSPALILAAIAIADSQRWADPDLWGHVRFGQAVLAQGHLIRHDPYSYSAPGHLWLNHEWLCEIVMGLMYNALGAAGLKLLKFACSAAAVLCLADALGETGAPIVLQMSILLASCVAICPQIQFRPQMFTMAGFAAVLALLSRYNYRGRAPLWIAIPIIALWSVLHGGFIMGLAALAAFGVVALMSDVFTAPGSRRGAAVLLVAAAAALTTLVMPYGLDAWRAVLHALSNPYTRRIVDDWQTLPHDLILRSQLRPLTLIFPFISIAMFLILAASVAAAADVSDLPMLAVALLTTLAAVTSTRNSGIATMAAAVPLAYHLSRRPQARHNAARVINRASLASQVAVGAIGMALLIFTGLFSKRILAWKPMPAGAVAFMRAHQLKGNLLTAFGWGEYALWHLSPQDKVFIDGRYDTVFPTRVILDYLEFHYAGEGARQMLRKYPHDFILLPLQGVPAYGMVATLGDWTPIYRDRTCALFARSDSAAARLPGPSRTADPAGLYFP